MQIWDFFNALLRFASPSLCSTSASSAEFAIRLRENREFVIPTAEKQVMRNRRDARIPTAKLPFTSIVNYEL